jgi:hypothetical protein
MSMDYIRQPCLPGPDGAIMTGQPSQAMKGR